MSQRKDEKTQLRRRRYVYISLLSRSLKRGSNAIHRERIFATWSIVMRMPVQREPMYGMPSVTCLSLSPDYRISMDCAALAFPRNARRKITERDPRQDVHSINYVTYLIARSARTEVFPTSGDTRLSSRVSLRSREYARGYLANELRIA